MYNQFMKKVKKNREGEVAKDAEKRAMEVLKKRYEKDTQRHTMAVQRRKKKRPFDDVYIGGEQDWDDIDANNDLSVAFAQPQAEV